MNSHRFLVSLFLISIFLISSCQTEPPMEEEKDPINNPTSLTQVPEIQAGDSYQLSGNIKDGELMDDLGWAELSNVACFPATRFVEFQGNQLYYSVDIPQGSEMTITVIPTGERRRINLFGYIHFDGTNTPPITSCRSCEAGYEIYAGTPNLNKPGEPQRISFSQAVNRGFTVFVGVSGAKDVLEGEFDLKFELTP